MTVEGGLQMTVIEPVGETLNFFSPTRLREQGWIFYYDRSTGFVGAKHPNGGQMTVAEVKPNVYGTHLKMAHEYVRILNSSGRPKS